MYTVKEHGCQVKVKKSSWCKGKEDLEAFIVAGDDDDSVFSKCFLNYNYIIPLFFFLPPDLLMNTPPIFS